MVSTRRSNRIAANAATAAKAAKASAPPAPKPAPKKTQPKRKTTTKKRAATKKTSPATLKKRRTGLSTSVSTVAPLGVVDPASKIAGQIHVLEDGHEDPEPCDVMLVLCDPAKNTDKFYVLQLIERTDGTYVVYSRWGRTGSVGQALEKDFDDLEGALKEFNKLFEDKTGLTWENRTEPTVGTKYRFVQQNFTEKQNGYSSATWQYWVDDGIDGKATGWYDYDSVSKSLKVYIYMFYDTILIYEYCHDEDDDYMSISLNVYLYSTFHLIYIHLFFMLPSNNP